MVLEHAVNVQLFYADTGIVLSIRLDGLEKEVAPLALDFEMSLGAIAGRFLVPIAALLTAAELTLLAAERPLALAIAAGVSNGPALRVSQEDFQAHIQPDTRMRAGLVRFMVLLWFRWLTGDQRIPVPIGPQDQMTRLGYAFNGAVQLDFQEQPNLAGDTQMLAIVMQAEIFWMLAQLNAMPAVGRLEAREAARDALLFAREIPSEGFVQPISHHLDRSGRDMLSTTPSKAGGQFVLKQKLPCLSIVVLPGGQHLIV
jgi:hypothetical protein